MNDETIQKFFDHVDQNKSKYIEELGQAVAIPSSSNELEEHLDDVNKMITWMADRIKSIGGKVTVVTNPKSTENKPLPDIILADVGDLSGKTDAAKKTVCCYGHLDVMPAKFEDGWDSDPWTLTERDGKLYGRGSTDDKGPVLSWLWVAEAYKALGLVFPVNVKFIFEGMEENGSQGLFEVIPEQAAEGKFLSDVDFFCISDNYWLGKTKPCLTYGLRGLAYFAVTVQCSEQDLHSGVMGGTVHEAMTDLVQLMASLIDTSGKILVEGVSDDVKPVTAEEEALYGPIDFNCDSFKDDCKVRSVSDKLLKSDKKSLLMARWRYPTLSMHGIEHAYAGVGAKTVIPAKATGKFSLRLVPDQDPERIDKVVRAHIEREFAKLQSPNKLTIDTLFKAKAWMSSPKHPNYEAAAAAIERVFGTAPDYTREGGSIPIATALEEATGGMNVLLLPTGACDDMAHSQNEKYNVINMLNGIKVLGLYLHELGKITGPKPSQCRCVPLTEEELMVPGAFMKGIRCKCEM